ncbi:MAG: 7-cyano-7-deazaguanine synthase, partial [Omnitrophica bacterium]|nr:7-cyano-7-deazaguanine synthase [Candidatus Omnitrophota bacterium]
MRNKRRKGKALVLLSGGIDSATALYIARDKGFRPLALIFDYGQRHKKEIDFAKRVARAARSPYKVIKVSFPGRGSSLLDKNKKIPVLGPFKRIKK